MIYIMNPNARPMAPSAVSARKFAIPAFAALEVVADAAFAEVAVTLAVPVVAVVAVAELPTLAEAEV